MPRRTPALLFLLATLAACDTFLDPALDAGTDAGTPADAGDESAPPRITFTQVNTAGALPPVRFTRAPDGYYALNSGTVLHTTDQARTLERRSTPGAFYVAVDSEGRVFIDDGTALKVSTDGARTFTPVSLPFTITPSTGGPIPFVTSDDALWILSRATPPQLFRSTDAAATFDEVTLPELTVPYAEWFRVGEDGFLYLRAANNHVFRTSDGAAWSDFGSMETPVEVFATKAGTILVSRREIGAFSEMRSTDGGATFTRTPTEKTYTYAQRPNGTLVRLDWNADLDESTDEGATWTHRETTGGVNTGELVAFDDEVLAITYQGVVRLANGAETWVRDVEPGLPHAATGRFIDLAFSRSGRAVIAGERRVWVSEDAGQTWRGAWTPDDATPLRCVAMRPDGERIFVGSTMARVKVLDGLATRVFYEGNLPGSREHVQQAQWTTDGNRAGHVLWVTTASDDHTKGQVFSSVPEDDSISWDFVNPLANPSSPQAIAKAGYHGFAITDPARGGDRSLFVAVRRFVGTNATNDELHVRLALGLSDPWMEVANPVNFGFARSISNSGVYGQPVAYVFPNNRVFLGGFSTYQQEAVVEGALGDFLSAKFAPDGRLWLVTSAGIFRSNEVFGER